jgi:hypothetical protein
MKNDKEVKKYVDFINEELEETTDMMANTASVYQKYRNKVVSSIDKEDLSKSEDEFNDFISSLPENEREASDMLRSLFSSEAMKIKIDGLEEQKKQIEEQISARIKELKDIQSNLG